MKHHVTAALGVALVAASAAEADRKVFEPTSITAPFIEQFGPDWSERWSSSSATKKQDGGEVFSYSGVWAVEEPKILPGLAGDTGLVAKSKAAQHAISAQFPTPVDVAAAMKSGKPLVVQYETKMQNGLSCGGAYLKLLTESAEGIQAKEFSDKTPYTIMFGPDKCGSTNKVHFIFRHPHPKTGELEEKHLTNGPYPKIGKTSAVYTLVVNPDQTYDVRINGEVKKAGSLFEDFEPSVNPEKEIDDPNSTKPEDWVDAPMMPDPDATKPDDWDEEAPPTILDEEASKPEDWLEDEKDVIPDPDAKKPEEWDDEEDGEWTAPMIPNPKCEAASGCGPWIRPQKPNPAYKGKWQHPQVANPAYKGLWSPAKIANPDYFEDPTPSHFTKIGGIGFEIWTMDEDILFDNIYVGHSIEDAQTLGNETWGAKITIEQGREEKELEELARKTAADEGIKINNAWDKIVDKVNDFVVAARSDPVAAVKASPDVAGGLAAAVAGLFGLVGLLGAVLGGSSKQAKPAAKPAKKIDEPKAKSTAVASASSEKAKKRPAAAKVEDDDE